MKTEAIRHCIDAYHRIANAYLRGRFSDKARTELTALETRIKELEELVRSALQVNEENDLSLLGARLDGWAIQAKEALANVGQHPSIDEETPPPSGGNSPTVEVPIERLREMHVGLHAAFATGDAEVVTQYVQRVVDWLGNLLGSPDAAKEGAGEG